MLCGWPNAQMSFYGDATIHANTLAIQFVQQAEVSVLYIIIGIACIGSSKKTPQKKNVSFVLIKLIGQMVSKLLSWKNHIVKLILNKIAIKCGFTELASTAI